MKTSVAGLASAFSLILCAAAVMPAIAAEPAWFSKASTVTFRGLSSAASRTIRLAFPPYSFAAAAGGHTVMYVNDSCKGKADVRFARSGTTDRSVPGIAALLKGSRMRIDGLALAPSGQRGAFVLRPCVRAAAAEASELGGIVYLVSLDDPQIVMLQGSATSNGLPVGVAMNPSFSYDERALLVNYEGGFDVFDIGTGTSVFNSGEAKQLAEGWANGLGWVSGDCIAVKSGRDYKAADAEQPLVLNWRTRSVLVLGSLLGSSSNSLLGLAEVHSDYAVRPAARGPQILSLRGSLTGAHVPKGVELVGLVADGPAAIATDFCGQPQ